MKQFTGLAVGILKGRAMHWIAFALKAKALNFHHIYIGDDITDEDAFNVLPENGTGILAGPHGQPSYADYKIDETDEVPDLLKSFIKMIRKNERMETGI
jgi:trehalose-6-phosphatase